MKKQAHSLAPKDISTDDTVFICNTIEQFVKRTDAILLPNHCRVDFS